MLAYSACSVCQVAVDTGYNSVMPSKYWSKDVTEHSNALDLDADVFTLRDPKKIAQSLKRSAEQSDRRKSEPYRSAMSMLTFYINRAGKNLPKKQLDVLNRAKDELRIAFGREPSAKTKTRRSTRSRRRSTPA
jgi:hypothetical protein